MSVINYVEDKITSEFYPTPENLAEKLLAKLDFGRVTSILEPSCGKGDFLTHFKNFRDNQKVYMYGKVRSNSAKGFIEKFNAKYNTEFDTINKIDDWLYSQNNRTEYVFVGDRHDKTPVEITCVEIDNNLCGILKQTYGKVINADFLSWMDFNSYDTVLMNPPFSNGDKHLLKAIQVIEASNGGQICCILNAETIRNPYSNTRQLLMEKLQEYNADIEYVDNAFADAERKAEVDVALIYIDIPVRKASEDFVKGLIKGDAYESCYEEINNTQLYAGNVIDLMCEQFAKEARLGIKLINTYHELSPFLSTMNGTSSPLIELNVCSSEMSGCMQNRFIHALREKYWSAAFQTSEISHLLTDKARETYLGKIKMFRDYDFTVSNIKALQIELNQHLNENIHESIVSLYDSFTYKHSMDNSKNVHMFSGWKTNDGFKINPKKVIMPLYLYSTYGSYGYWDMWKARDFCVELEKVMTYLDGGQTEGESADSIVNNVNKKEYYGERICFKYFDCEFKKKGTVHIFWKRDDLIKKLTIIGCKAHGSLPSNYGEKKYADLTEEEKKIVENFEGKGEYFVTHLKKQYVISNNAQNLLMING